MALLKWKQFLLPCYLADYHAVVFLGLLIEIVPLLPVLYYVQTVLVEMLDAVENLAELPAVYCYVDTVYCHCNIDYVSHVLGELLCSYG